jgi:hypothetical protein
MTNSDGQLGPSLARLAFFSRQHYSKRINQVHKPPSHNDRPQSILVSTLQYEVPSHAVGRTLAVLDAWRARGRPVPRVRQSTKKGDKLDRMGLGEGSHPGTFAR